MKRTPWRLVACLAGLTLVVAATSATAAPSSKKRAHVAARFLVNHQKANGSFPAFSPIGSTADGLIALVAATRSAAAVRAARHYLATRTDDIDGIGSTAKVAMAAVAGGKDPRDFGGRNLVHAIAKKERKSGRYGRGTAVLDQALAVLALKAAGHRKSPSALAWLAGAQCRDGGWQYDAPASKADNKHCNSGDAGDFFRSDTNTTSYAVQALKAAGYKGSLAHSPFAYFKLERGRVIKSARMHRGYAYDLSLHLTDANSTALVLQAYAAAGKTPPRGARHALAALQYHLCGAHAGAFAFSWVKRNGAYHHDGHNLGATIGAIPGVLGRALPVRAAAHLKPAPRPGSCS